MHNTIPYFLWIYVNVNEWCTLENNKKGFSSLTGYFKIENRKEEK